MPVVRVYLPLSRGDLDELAAAGALTAGPAHPRAAYAVTADLERAAPGLDVDDLEYSAFCHAVDAAASARGSAGDRRVVASADADPSWVEPSAAAGQSNPRSAVLLTASLPLSRVASLHIDEHAAEHPDGNADSEGNESAEGGELLWYDVTEIGEVQALLA